MRLLLTLPAIALTTLYLGHQANNIEIPTDDRYKHYIELQTELSPEPTPEITYYEDGSDSTGYCTPGALCDDTVQETPAPAPEATPTTPPAPPADEVIYEDDPRWDCTTMGNRICGTDINGTWYLLDFNTGTFAPRN